MAQLLVLRGGDDFKIGRELLLQRGIDHAHGDGVGDFRGAQGARIGGDDEEVVILRRSAVLVGFLAKFDVDETARKWSARAGHFDALPADGVVDLERRGIILEAERERRQLLRDGHGGVIADGANHSAFAVERGERLQHIVQLRRGEVDRYALVAADRAGMLEVAHAVFVEHDLADGQVDCRRRSRRG